MQNRRPMSVINPSIPKVQENKIQSMKLKMPGMERQRGWAFSRCVRLSSGYSMIHFSFSLNTGHKRVRCPIVKRRCLGQTSDILNPCVDGEVYGPSDFFTCLEWKLVGSFQFPHSC